MEKTTTFQYFRYFLNPLKQASLLEDKRDKRIIFQEILRKGKIEYEHRGVQLALVQVQEKNGYFVAKLGKRSSIKRILSPEKNFEETFEENWPYCTLIINTNEAAGEGQQIAFEYKSSVFTSPSEQLSKLAHEINNQLFGSGYVISINPITEIQEFWKIIEKSQDRIEKLTFTFNVPNLFSLNNSLSKELKDLQTEYGSTSVSLALENPDGKLKVPKNELTKQGAEYVTKGGGEYKIKLKGKVHKEIKSKNNIKIKTFDFDIEAASSNQQALFDIFGKIFE